MIWPFTKKSTKQIARLEITGVIASDTREQVLRGIEIVKNRKFPALLLRIDSPGGTVADSQEIYQALKELQKTVKIFASFGNIAASGGVYIGMGAECIFANPGTITGSIGVILRGNNLERLLDKIGVSFKVIKSGPYKDILSFDRQLTEPEEQILQELIDTSYLQFVQTVATERSLPLATVKSFADGRIFTGQQALALGVVDRLGTEADARRELASLVGLKPETTKCYNIEEPKSVLKRLFPGRSQAQSPLNMTMDYLSFEIATTGQLLWLYRP